MDKSGRSNDDHRGLPRHFLTPDGKKMDKSPSLVGMHAQSSTETSGLGETITSGFSSQDSVLSGRDLENHNNSSTDATVVRNPKSVSVTDENIRGVTRIGRKPVIRPIGTQKKSYAPVPATADVNDDDMFINQTNFDALFMQSAADAARGVDENNVTSRMNSSGGQTTTTTAAPTNNSHHQRGGEPVDEWDRRGSMRSSIRSHSSIGSFRSRNGSRKSPRRFLGVGTKSTWMKWSEERRASYRRRIELLDKPKVDTERVTTPIKKARQECLKFVHPDLEKNYLSEDDINDLKRHKQQQYYTYSVIEKSKKGRYPVRTEVHLTVAEWNIINDFWQHNLFQRTRYVGVAISFFTLILQILSITSSSWISYTRHLQYGTLDIHEGLYTFCLTNHSKGTVDECKFVFGGQPVGIWDSCYNNVTAAAVITDPSMCEDKKPYWQNAVLGLMMFAASFGALAAVLSICGVLTTPLPKKIYYYHSAGEIFLICALSTTVALIIFPVAIENDLKLLTHHYGTGYGLGWGGTIFFFAAALCMSLDDIVRESSTSICCTWCMGSSKQPQRRGGGGQRGAGGGRSISQNRTELQQV